VIRFVLVTHSTEYLYLLSFAGEGTLRECALTSDSCRITYKIDSLKFGTEDNLVIFIDNTTGIYRDLHDGKSTS